MHGTENPQPVFWYFAWLFYGTTSNANQYNWDFGDGTSTSLQNPSHSYSNSGTYQVTFIGYNGTCSDQDQISINFVSESLQYYLDFLSQVQL